MYRYSLYGFSFYSFHFRFLTLILSYNVDEVALGDGWCTSCCVICFFFYLSVKYKWHDGDEEMSMNLWRTLVHCTLQIRSPNGQWENKNESTDYPLLLVENVHSFSVRVVDSHQLKNANLFLKTFIRMRQCHYWADIWREHKKKNTKWFARRIKGWIISISLTYQVSKFRAGF